MKTEEKIKQCESLLAELKQELLDKSEPEFKVGDWITDMDNSCMPYLFRIIEWNGEYPTGYGFFGDLGGSKWYNNFNVTSFVKKDYRHATPDEIKEHLIKEAERRGFVEGVRFYDVSRKEIETVHLGNNWFYNDMLDALGPHGCGWCYAKGKWAEIIKTTTIKLNDSYEAEPLDNGDVKVGSQTFSFDKIKEVYKAAKAKRQQS